MLSCFKRWVTNILCLLPFSLRIEQYNRLMNGYLSSLNKRLFSFNCNLMDRRKLEMMLVVCKIVVSCHVNKIFGTMFSNSFTNPRIGVGCQWILNKCSKNSIQLVKLKIFLLCFCSNSFNFLLTKWIMPNLFDNIKKKKVF